MLNSKINYYFHLLLNSKYKAFINFFIILLIFVVSYRNDIIYCMNENANDANQPQINITDINYNTPYFAYQNYTVPALRKWCEECQNNIDELSAQLNSEAITSYVSKTDKYARLGDHYKKIEQTIARYKNSKKVAEEQMAIKNHSLYDNQDTGFDFEDL